MNVAFHRCQHDLAVAFTLLFAGIDKRFKPGHRLFHYACRLDHLRQEHFPLAEQIADHVHACHQRPFNDINRASRLQARLFGIFFDKFGNAFYQGVFKAFRHIPGAPFGLLSIGGIVAFTATVFFRQFQQPFGTVFAPVQNDIFNRITQFRRQIVINRQLPGVDDAHVHAVTNGVIKEYRVDGFTHRIVTTE